MGKCSQLKLKGLINWRVYMISENFIVMYAEIGARPEQAVLTNGHRLTALGELPSLWRSPAD